eukprot:8525694-Prorocentrum_lima.AAC.1
MKSCQTSATSPWLASVAPLPHVVSGPDPSLFHSTKDNRIRAYYWTLDGDRLTSSEAIQKYGIHNSPCFALR